MSSELSTVPVGWIRTSIGTVLEFQYGKGLRRDNRDVSGSVPVYGSNGIVGYHSVPLTTSPSIIVGRKGAIGAVHLATVPCWPIDTTYYVFPPDGIDISFLYYFLASCNLGSLDKSTAIPGLNRDDAYKMPIPLPPLPEQHRIVAKIEELFTRLDAGVEALKKVKAQLKRYRQAVLKHAFEGKLTEQWRQAHKRELEPASALLERIKQERHQTAKGKHKELIPLDTADLPDLPEGWMWARLGDIVDIIRGASPRPKGDPRYFGGDIPWIMISDISKERGRYISVTRDTVTKEGAKKSRYLKKGTLILSNSGTVCVPKILAVDGCIHDGFIAFPDITDQIDTMYLYHIFDYIRPGVIQANRQGVTQVNLNTDIVANIIIPSCATLEQHEIVSEIERRFSTADDIEKTVDHSLKQAERLRQSILKQAFEGKLVPQHPSDEPAERLLERIKAGRTKHTTEAKAAGKSNKRLRKNQRRPM
jgi:type I restriction enzyme S subunit